MVVRIEAFIHFIFRRTCKYNCAADMDYQIATARQFQVITAKNATEEIGQQEEVEGRKSVQHKADTNVECNTHHHFFEHEKWRKSSLFLFYMYNCIRCDNANFSRIRIHSFVYSLVFIIALFLLCAHAVRASAKSMHFMQNTVRNLDSHVLFYVLILNESWCSSTFFFSISFWHRDKSCSSDSSGS